MLGVLMSKPAQSRREDIVIDDDPFALHCSPQ